MTTVVKAFIAIPEPGKLAPADREVISDMLSSALANFKLQSGETCDVLEISVSDDGEQYVLTDTHLTAPEPGNE